MRFAVMADIHGNLPALEATLEDMRQFSVDGVIVAGDLVVGPQPVETIRLIRSLGDWVIRGNNENYLLRYQDDSAPEAWRTSRQWGLTRWNYDQLDCESRAYLKALPEQQIIDLDGLPAIRVVHGSPRHLSEQLHPERDPGPLYESLEMIEEPVMICGHTHKSWKYEYGYQLALNPGAIGCPLDGFIGAQYALLTWHADHWEVQHRYVPYEIDRIRAVFYTNGSMEYGGAFARAYLATIETGKDAALDFVLYAQRLAEQAGYQGYDAVPDEIWEQASETFHWSRYELN